MVLGLRRQDRRSLTGVVLLHMRLGTGRGLKGTGTSTLRRCLICALQVWMLSMLLILWRILHRECPLKRS